MGRQPDDHGRADEPARDCHRKVALAHVDPVRSESRRHVGTVVDHEERSVPSRRRGEHLAPCKEIAGLGILFPELDDVGPRAEDHIEEVLQVATVPPGIGDNVQTRPRQAIPPPPPGALAVLRLARPRTGRSDRRHPPATARTSSR